MKLETGKHCGEFEYLHIVEFTAHDIPVGHLGFRSETREEKCGGKGILPAATPNASQGQWKLPQKWNLFTLGGESTKNIVPKYLEHSAMRKGSQGC